MSGDTEFETRRKIFDEIKKFNRTEQEELYRILKRNSEEISENRNGMFFDLMSLKEETIQSILKWIEFCLKNHTALESREKELSDLASANPGLSIG